IVRDGELDRKGLRAERMNPKDVMAELRQGGIDDMREVKLATVENDGRVSVLKQSWAEELQKGDLDPEQKQRRQARLGDAEEPPPEKRTDSERSLGYAS
ncbi:MAG TPA: YetF domain-containing protein, partial [Gemmatimonadales bacterium]|nr:YetF domain-containing protein [Gemmatimonadales bacterium]